MLAIKTKKYQWSQVSLGKKKKKKHISGKGDQFGIEFVINTYTFKKLLF